MKKFQTLLLGFMLSIGAVSFVAAQTVSQSFQADAKNTPRGSIVTIDPDNPDSIIAASKTESAYGVVVSNSDTAVSITGEKTGSYVASIGRYEVLVSSESGNIGKGQKLALSSIKGVARAAAEIDEFALGIAVEATDFTNNGPDVVTEQELTTDGNEKIKVKVVRILVDFQIGRNPGYKNPTKAPKALVALGEAIAGKEVSLTRIYLGMAIVATSLVTTFILTYSSVRGSFLAIGRNPLSKASVLRGLMISSLLSLAIFALGLAGTFLIMRL
jgi:hypothetical protein